MSMLCHPADSTLLIIDPQARLMPAIHDAETVIRALRAARARRRASSASTSSAPRRTRTGSGRWCRRSRALCDTTLAKFHFAATAEEGFLSRLPHGPQHLRRRRLRGPCLRHADGGRPARRRPRGEVGRRRGRLAPSAQPLSATERARKLGADIVTTEMVIFEWLGTSEHPKFRRLLQLVR